MASQIDRNTGAARSVTLATARPPDGAKAAEGRLAAAASTLSRIPRVDADQRLKELGAPGLHARRIITTAPEIMPMSGEASLPDIDVTTPSPARMYDYYLGGKDNFPADRRAAEKALSVVPQGRAVARANRSFMVRAVRFMARNGVRQFIDLGTGIPTSPNVHEIARGITPDARVAYVDNDPVVTMHNRTLLANNNDGIAAIYGDVRYPLDIVTSGALRQIIDFSQPVAVLFVAVLHFLTNGEDPYNSVGVFRDHMSAGGYLAVSHITSDGTDSAVITAIRDAYANASAPAVFRTREQIREFFTGFDLVKPGLTEISRWPGNNRKTAELPALRFLGGVGVKR